MNLSLPAVIAMLPLTLLSVVVFVEVKAFIALPFLWDVFIFSAFFFSILILFLRIIFFGTFKGVNNTLDKEDPGSLIRASLGMVMLLLFFGLAFLVGVKDSLTEAEPIELFVAMLSSGLMLAFLINLFEYKVLEYFEIEKANNGIAYSDLSKYLTWYHYIMILFLVFTTYVLFFTA